MTAQLDFREYRMRNGRGGRRPGAGRPRIHASRVAHETREKIPSGCPVHVTLKVRGDVPRLRTKRLVRAFRRSLAQGCERGEFRVVHYAIQTNHVHLLVEARGKAALARGMKSLGARFARAVNRTFARKGPVLRERFHHRALRTPAEVRNALAYVLLNVRKHWRERTGAAPPARFDTASSGAWFDGWRRPPPGLDSEGPRDVAPARSWLLRVGWRRRGLIDPLEVPGTA